MVIVNSKGSSRRGCCSPGGNGGGGIRKWVSRGLGDGFMLGGLCFGLG